jgi:hypothetical protein
LLLVNIPPPIADPVSVGSVTTIERVDRFDWAALRYPGRAEKVVAFFDPKETLFGCHLRDSKERK